MLRISANDAYEVTVRRDPEVNEVLWTKVTNEWGHDGDPTRAIKVRVDAFLSNLDWLPQYCQRYSTGIDWNDGARALVTRSRQEQQRLDVLLKGVTPLSTSEVAARLEGGRFNRSLREFQLRDLGKLLALPNGANFSVPGAGKTTVTYALYEAERRRGTVDRLLVVAPLSAFEAWSQEAVDCFSIAPSVHHFRGGTIASSAEVVLVNYQRLHRAHKAVANWATGGKCHVVLDEAHRMKRGWTGQWGRSSLNLAYYAARRDVLTGTPAPQGLKDLNAILDFAWPGQARRILPAEILQRSASPELADQTGKAIRPLFVRTTKSDMELKKPKIDVVQIPLEGLQLEIYTALKNRYAGQLALARSDRTMLARMGQVAMYLLEAATNPSLLPLAGPLDPKARRPRFPLLEIPANGQLPDLIRKYPDFEVAPKIVHLGKIVRDNAAQGKKTLVWTNFINNITLLEETFRSLQPAVIHGGIPPEAQAPRGRRTREAELARFRHDPACALLLANPAATSEGVSLHHHCHDAVYLDRTFNAGHYLQSIDRIHRLGLSPEIDTTITILQTLNTVDVTVDNQVEAKAKRLGSILRDDDIRAMALPDDDDYKEVVADEDLVALFAHLHGEDAGGRPDQQ